MSYDGWDLNNLESIDPQRLSRVWPGAGGGLLEAAGWGEADLVAILRHQLDAPIELGAIAVVGSTYSTAPPAPRTFRELLHHPSPPAEWVAWLKRVKDFAKPLMGPKADPDAPLPREVAAVLYFAAAVVGKVRTGMRVSSLDDHGLTEGAKWALTQPWLDAPTAELFRQGLAVLGG